MFWKRSSLAEKPQCSFCHSGEDAAGELIGAPSNDSHGIDAPLLYLRR